MGNLRHKGVGGYACRKAEAMKAKLSELIRFLHKERCSVSEIAEATGIGESRVRHVLYYWYGSSK